MKGSCQHSLNVIVWVFFILFFDALSEIDGEIAVDGAVGDDDDRDINGTE